MFGRREQVIEPMLLSPRATAKVLGICEKTLWTLTQRGEIPAIHIGRAVRYDISDVKAWIKAKKSQKAVDIVPDRK